MIDTPTPTPLAPVTVEPLEPRRKGLPAVKGPGRRHRGDLFCASCGHWHGPEIHPPLPPLFPKDVR